ncbi:MAG: hypothetical protein NXI27_19770 [Alphaproteobacteria bacterium]|nr:hypothetical protein [Alphaproteobacteria bacterium]
MYRLGWLLSGVLAVVIAAMTYFLVLPGGTKKAEDGRAIIVLAPSERDFVLAEMRGFLETLETLEAMTIGLADRDMPKVATSARSRGLENEGDAPASIVAKLPWAFKSLAMDTHRAFDTLAAQAEQGADRQAILSGLGGLMNKCTTCHAGYRFDVESEVK